MEINHVNYVPIAEYSTVFGYPMDDAVFKDMLSNIGCQKAIAILSRFSSLHIALCGEIQDAVYLHFQLRMIHAKHIRDSGGDGIKYNQFRAVMCPQSIFSLEKWVLEYCPKEDVLSSITLNDLILVMDALLVINDKLPKSEVEGHETEYLYLTLYHNTHKVIKNQIARSFYVFSTLAKCDTGTTEFLNSYEQKRGFSIEDRLAMLTNSLAGVIPQFTIEGMFAKGICIEAEGFEAKGLALVYDKITQSLRDEYQKAKKSVSKVLEQIWNFEPFYRSPFVKIGDLQFAYSETPIIYQMWEGLYWDVRYTFEEEGEIFMTNFGKPFELYIRNITCDAVAESKSNVLFQDEFLYKFQGKSRASTDCYIRIGETLIAIEAKAKSPHSDTLTGVSREAIDVEVKNLMIDPVTQALTRLKEICSGDNDIKGKTADFFKGVKHVIVLSVSMEKVQPIGELLNAFDAEIKSDLPEIQVLAYHNINVEDFEVVCYLIETCAAELPTIFTSWFASQREDVRSAVLLVNYLPSCGKKYICSKYVSKLFSDSLREISLKTFGKDILPTDC